MPLMTLQTDNFIRSVEFSKDGDKIASGSYDQSVRVWDASTGAALQHLSGHTGSVNSVAFSHNDMHIVSGSCDKSVRVWDASKGAALQQPNGHIVSDSEATSIWIWNEMCHDILWTSTMDGWILSLPLQDRLMWIPQGICNVLHHPYNSLIISEVGYAHIDFQGCNLGTKWVECYKPCV